MSGMEEVLEKTNGRRGGGAREVEGREQGSTLCVCRSCVRCMHVNARRCPT